MGSSLGQDFNCIFLHEGVQGCEEAGRWRTDHSRKLGLKLNQTLNPQRAVDANDPNLYMVAHAKPD